MTQQSARPTDKEPRRTWRPCDWCDATGKIDGATCHNCKGHGGWFVSEPWPWREDEWDKAVDAYLRQVGA
jgi:hypothetical protein